MNRKDRSYQPEYATKDRAAVKTMNLQVAVTEPDLLKAVWEAFTLAKSSGLELDLAFIHQAITPSIPTEPGIKPSQRTQA